MARLSSSVRLLLHFETRPETVVGQLNHELCTAGLGDRFITFLLVELDPAAHRIRSVSAGHPCPLVRRASGTVECLGEADSGTPLALVDGCAYRAAETTLHPGDTVVLLTDGVLEALDPSGRPLGLRRILDTLRAAPPGPEPTGRALLDLARAHAAVEPQHDDITLVCFGRAPDPAPPGTP
jgi:serine phosphatase RsbU (regulator of sigma subunit)